jgi:hypothetical protein
MRQTLCRSVVLATAAVALVGCSSGTKKVASSPTTRVPTTTATTGLATTTTGEATTTTSLDSSNLQDHVIAPPAGYSFASSLGDLNNINTPGGSSGDMSAADVSNLLGIPTAATNLHFQKGYGQFYHYDGSPPNSTVRDLEIDVLEFDGVGDAIAFVQQAADRAVSQFVRASKIATVVAGAPAITVNDNGKAPDGTYQKVLVAAHNNRAVELYYGDTTARPSAFLATVAALEYAKL